MTAMTVRTVTALISADEFLSQDYPIGSELIDGVVHMNDPGFRHQRCAAAINEALLLWSRAAADRGRPGWGGNWVLSDRNVYKPDVWWTAIAPEGTRNDGPARARGRGPVPRHLAPRRRPQAGALPRGPHA